MGFLDKLFGRDEAPPAHAPLSSSDALPQGGSTRALSADEQAGARYLYLLKTAPPEEIEKAHEEAFAKLSPEQRRQVLEKLGQVVPQQEYSRLGDDPQSLARAATRAEMQRPGSMRQAFGGGGMGGGAMSGGMGMGMGSMMMGGLFASLAGAFIGTSVAQAFFNNPSNEADYQQSPESGGESSESGDGNDASNESDSSDASGDSGYDSSYDASTGEVDAGFDSGDFGGDFGGGDFGGGDF